MAGNGFIKHQVLRRSWGNSLKTGGIGYIAKDYNIEVRPVYRLLEILIEQPAHYDEDWRYQNWYHDVEPEHKQPDENQ